MIKSFLFLLPPEKAHHTALALLSFFVAIPGGKRITRALFSYSSTDLSKSISGLNFKNPLGLAAGFDKNAEYIELMDLLGFGFIEIGTVTPLAQGGNPRPRLFRLPKDQALINRMGFNNKGVDQAVRQLQKVKNKDIIIGGNIGKNKVTPNDKAVDDYLICFERLFPYVDYFVVNVSSPNTPGLRSLQDPEALTIIFEALQKSNREKNVPKPIFVKIAPDLELSAIGEIVELSIQHGLKGIIATNTTISRQGLNTSSSIIESIGSGGLSGQPIKNRATEVVRFIHEKAAGRLTIIGVGGIQSPADAREKLDAGADLIQAYTGFIYEGPGMAKRICKSLKGIKKAAN